MHAHEFIVRISVKVTGGRIRIDDTAARIENGQAIRDRIKDVSVALLALLQALDQFRIQQREGRLIGKGCNGRQ